MFKFIAIVAALAIAGTLSFGAIASGSKNIQAHQSKIAKILDEAN